MDDILVDDRCMMTSRGGIATYLRSVLSHWPGRKKPVGFCGRYFRWRYSDQPGGQDHLEAFRLRPLAQLIAETPAMLPEETNRRLDIGIRVYEAAYRAASLLGRFRLQFEPNYLPMPIRGLTVTTCCDVSVLEHPEWHPAQRVKRWQEAIARSMKITDQWITISHFSRRRMEAVLGIPPEKVEVIHLAARQLPKVDEDTIHALRSEGQLPDSYVLHLGTIEPRKNVEVLLDAWQQIRSDLPSGSKLVLAGSLGWGGLAFRKRLASHQAAGDVLATGGLTDAQVSTLIMGARALLAPSWYEGFGLPVVEAMAAGIPVACSDIDVFNEVASDAAEYLHPQDVDGWASVIARSFLDASWRKDLIERGHEREKLFSWTKAAGAHAALFAKMRKKL
ncbi:MAG: glycosyltransferase family 4 protein [Phycisphaerae bacterium]